MKTTVFKAFDAANQVWIARFGDVGLGYCWDEGPGLRSYDTNHGDELASIVVDDREIEISESGCANLVLLEMYAPFSYHEIGTSMCVFSVARPLREEDLC